MGSLENITQSSRKWKSCTHAVSQGFGTNLWFGGLFVVFPIWKEQHKTLKKCLEPKSQSGFWTLFFVFVLWASKESRWWVHLVKYWILGCWHWKFCFWILLVHIKWTPQYQMWKGTSKTVLGHPVFQQLSHTSNTKLFQNTVSATTNIIVIQTLILKLTQMITAVKHIFQFTRSEDKNDHHLFHRKIHN